MGDKNMYRVVVESYAGDIDSWMEKNEIRNNLQFFKKNKTFEDGTIYYGLCYADKERAIVSKDEKLLLIATQKTTKGKSFTIKGVRYYIGEWK